MNKRWQPDSLCSNIENSEIRAYVGGFIYHNLNYREMSILEPSAGFLWPSAMVQGELACMGWRLGVGWAPGGWGPGPAVPLPTAPG